MITAVGWFALFTAAVALAYAVDYVGDWIMERPKYWETVLNDVDLSDVEL